MNCHTFAIIYNDILTCEYTKRNEQVNMSNGAKICKFMLLPSIDCKLLLVLTVYTDQCGLLPVQNAIKKRILNH